MMRKLPTIQFNILHCHDNGQDQLLTVDSPPWYTWLTTATSFTFVNENGTFSARKEQTGNQRGGWYWRAYCRREGKLHRVYLGKSENLTLQRLNEAAQMLTLTSEKIDEHTEDLLPLASQVIYDPLLATKLHVPRPGSHLIHRPRLTQRLQQNWAKTLILLSAPAGFGKSTLLAEWLAESSIPTAWLSLETQENKLEHFLTYLIAALQTLAPNIGKTALALLYSQEPAPIEIVLTLLLNDLTASAMQPFLLILNDYHVIMERSVHEAVTFLLDHQPRQMHLLLATREDPPLPLARLRGQNALYELRAADLRFSIEETAAFLIDTMALPLSAEESAWLHARTEGWITGLHLAALAMQGREDLSTFIKAFTGSHYYVMDYILQEVLERLPEGMQKFLLQTSILERLNTSLCNAVCAWENSQVILEQLARTNLFIIPLDDQRQWFRYHHLFAEVLRHRLQQTTPTLIPELHRRASLWYEQAGLFESHQAPFVAVRLIAPGEPDEHATRRDQSRCYEGKVEPLTARESDVLCLLREGATNHEIACKLVLSINTVKKHIVNLYGKLHVQNRVQAITRASMLGLL